MSSALLLRLSAGPTVLGCFGPTRRQPRAARRELRCRSDQKPQREEWREQDDAAAGGRERRALLAAALLLAGVRPASAVIKGYEPMEALKGKDYGKLRYEYSDYVQTASGLQYQDIKVGEGPSPKEGQTCVVDWAGVTVGYYGRPFEARNKPKGSAFTGDDKDFYPFVLGAHTVIPAFEEAVATMKAGGIRRIIVPVELGYPQQDFNRGVGPVPSTFSGKRALDFVLKNQGFIDKTLLFDIELISVR